MYLLINPADNPMYLVVHYPSMDAGEWAMSPEAAVAAWNTRSSQSHYSRNYYSRLSLFKALAQLPFKAVAPTLNELKDPAFCRINYPEYYV